MSTFGPDRNAVCPHQKPTLSSNVQIDAVSSHSRRGDHGTPAPYLFVRRGVPAYIRSDNGSEFTAKKVREWLARVGVKTLFIEPGSPWENGYCESFNGRLRDELLAWEQFDTLLEAKVLIERWRRHYGCFGSLKMHPWVMFAIDVAAVWALLVAAVAPGSTESLSSMNLTYITVYVILAISAFALMLWHQPAILGGNTLIDGSTDLVILEPEAWIGQEFPLTKYLTPPVSIENGVVLIYHHDCPDCQRALPRYVDLANSVPMERQVVLVEVPPLGEPGAYGDATHTTLKSNKEWFVEAPVEVRIQGGQVTDVRYSGATSTDNVTANP